LTGGTTGAGLNAAGSAGDPWTTAIPGAYSAGSAGHRLGNIPDVAAGGANGLFIAGTNAATSITTALTANITGNLSGTVGSVTGAVGSVTGNVGGNVTGSVGSVTGAVGSVTGAVGSVTGAVGSVTGNVGGNVVGSVGSVAAVSDKTGYALSAGGVTAVQSGLSTLTAGQVNAEVVDVLRTDAIPDSVSADGAQPTIAQAIYMIAQYLTERSISGTTLTVNKPDGTSALMTFTLNSDTAPTAQTRAS